MARYKSAAARRASKEAWAGGLKIGLVVIVVIALAAAYFIVAAQRPNLNEETLCPPQPESYTVLLVDVTDPMNVAQRQDFLNQLARLKDSIPRYGQLAIVQVDRAAERLLRPVIVRCNPGRASDVSEWTGNPRAVGEQRERGFDRPLDRAFERLSSASGAQTSPILESIQSVALTILQSPAAEGRPHRLIVASDLLQNTDRINFYRGVPDPTAFVASPAFQTVRTDLRDVEVELWMLQRSDSTNTQPRALADLWDRIITEQRGNVSRVYRVSG